MGILTSIGIGMGAAAKAAQPFILNMQEAEIQQLRDDRLAEIAKSSAKWAEDYKAEKRRAEGAELSSVQQGLISARTENMASAYDQSNPELAKFMRVERGGDEMETAQAGAEAANRLGMFDKQREFGDQIKDINASEYNKSRNAAQDKRNAMQDEYNNRRETRLDALNAAQMKHLSASEGKAAEREARAATAKALDGVNADIKSLEKEAANPMLPTEQAAVIKTQLEAARTEATGYRKLLAGAGIKGEPEQKSTIDTLFPAKTPVAKKDTAPAAGSAQPASRPSRTVEQVDAEIKPLQKTVEVFGMDTPARKAQLKALYAERNSLLGNK